MTEDRKIRNLEALKRGRETAARNKAQKALESICAPIEVNPQEHGLNVSLEEMHNVGPVAKITAGGAEAPPMKAIREFCLQCLGGSSMEVSVCSGYACPLWSYRFGRSPKSAENTKPGMLNRDHVRNINAIRRPGKVN